ncbi:MAG TPA: hypothetical protein PKI22_08745 [Hydrogenophilus thermoluteolus]|nr:hypothetical protein [Hydrogenophilus thermoluteolus]
MKPSKPAFLASAFLALVALLAFGALYVTVIVRAFCAFGPSWGITILAGATVAGVLAFLIARPGIPGERE